MKQSDLSKVSIFAYFILSLSLYCFDVSEGYCGYDQKLEFSTSVTAPPNNMISTFIPLVISLSNYTANDRIVNITILTKESYRTHKIHTTLTVKAPAGQSRFEVPIYNCNDSYGYMEVVFYVDGRTSEQLKENISLYRSSSADDVSIIAICETSSFQNAIQNKFKPVSPSSSSRSRSKPSYVLHTLTTTQAYNKWQSYTGLYGFVALEGSCVNRLSSRQIDVLSNFVRFGEGRLLLVGKSPDVYLRRLNMSVNSFDEFGKICCGTGIIYTLSSVNEIRNLEIDILRRQEKNNILKKFEINTAARNLIQPPSSTYSYSGRNFNSRYSSDFWYLLNGLYEIPVMGFVILSLAFTAVLGPVNFLYLRKRRKLVYFYITTPIIAFLGMVIITLYSIISQGITPQINESSLLLHDLDTNDGAAYQAKGFYFPIYAESLEYPEDTVALCTTPSSSGNYLTFSNDLTFGNILHGGYVTSRKPSGIYTITPKRLRMGVLFERTSSDEILIKNELPYTVTRGAVVMPIDDISDSSGRGQVVVYDFEKIPAGDSLRVKGQKFSYSNPYVSCPNNFYRLISKQKLCFLPMETFRNKSLIVAQVEKLPYMESGGIENFRAKNGAFYYLGFCNHKNYTAD